MPPEHEYRNINTALFIIGKMKKPSKCLSEEPSSALKQPYSGRMYVADKKIEYFSASLHIILLG